MNERISFEKHPMLINFVPCWWHLKGAQMVLDPQKSFDRQIMLSSPAALLSISEYPFNDQIWIVSWSLQHKSSLTSGSVKMEQNTLESAFGLNDSYPRKSVWLISDYGGTCAKEETFIRWGDYLNIPCPGTNHNGDPNISILLIPEIKQAVLELITSRGLTCPSINSDNLPRIFL